MEPGDVLFFHCNTLHRSDKNNSDKRRWTLLCCYNLADNNPFIEHHHPNYTPIKKLEDKEIKKAGLKFLNPNEAAAFVLSSLNGSDCNILNSASASSSFPDRLPLQNINLQCASLPVIHT